MMSDDVNPVWIGSAAYNVMEGIHTSSFGSEATEAKYERNVLSSLVFRLSFLICQPCLL